MVGDAGEVEGEAAAGEGDGVDTGAAIHSGELGGVATEAVAVAEGGEVGVVEYKAIVAGAAVEHIGTAATDQGVVAGPGGEGFGGGGAAAAVVAGGAEPVEGGLGEGAGGGAENHVAAACITITEGSADDQVREAIAVHITGGRNTETEAAAEDVRVDHEAAAAGGNGGEIHPPRGCFAEHHKGTGIATKSIPSGANDQIAKAIAIHIAGAGHVGAAAVVGGGTIDHKAAAAGGDGGKIKRCRAGFAEHHVGAAGIRASGGIAFRSADDQVSEAIAVDIAGTGNADKVAVASALASDREPANAVADVIEINWRGGGFAEDHITEPDGVGRRDGANNEICKAIAIHIAGTGDTGAAAVVTACAGYHETARPCANG